MLLQPSAGSEDIHMAELVLYSFFIPFVTWPVFLPLGFGTLFLCRFAAARRYYSLTLWVLFWSVLGVVCGWVVPNIILGWGHHNEGMTCLLITGAVVGALFAPLLRYAWKVSYGEQEYVNWK